MKKIAVVLLLFSFILSLFSQSIAINNTDIKWTKKARDITGDIKSVTYGNGMFVAVGEQGLIATSKNGMQWKWVDSGTSYDLNKIIWNGKIFVTVGRSGAILTSTDGTKWTKRNSPANDDFRCIAWNGKYFLAVSFFPYKSVDGITWTVMDIDLKSFNILPDFAAALVWDGKQFLLFGNGRSSVITSKDGRIWEQRKKEGGSIKDAAYNGKIYVMVGSNGYFATSTNGINWTDRNLENVSSLGKSNHSHSFTYIEGITWTGDRFIAVGYNGHYYDRVSVIITSQDGITWSEMPVQATQFLNGVYSDSHGSISVGSYGCILKYDQNSGWINTDDNTLGNIRSIAFNGRHYVGVADRGKVLVSANGYEWKNIHIQEKDEGGSTLADWSSITWNGDFFVAVGHNGTTMISQDGENWEVNRVDGAPSFQSVTWDGSRFIAVSGYLDIGKYDISFEASGVSEKGAVYTSIDGINWVKASTPAVKSLASAASNSAVKVAVGAGGTILTSGDGTVWTKRESATTKNLLSVVYDGKGFTAAGIGIVLYSKDGINWLDHTTGVQGMLKSVIWDGRRFVGVAYNTDNNDTGKSSIAFSNNGTDWSSKPLPEAISSIDAMIFDGKKYIAQCSEGKKGAYLATSTDGIRWDSRLKINNNICKIVYSGKQYIAIGDSGSIFSSNDGFTWTKRQSGTSLDLYSITWTGKQFIAVGSESAQQVLITSKDGIKWVKGNSDVKNRSGFVNQVFWNGKDILVLRDAYAALSKDLTKWTKNDDVGIITFNKVLWNGSFYVAASGESSWPGKIVTSYDGLHWTERVSLELDQGLTSAIRDVAWSGKQYIALGTDDIFLSKDGIHWDEVTFSMTKKFTSIATNGKSYVAAGTNGLLCTSADGVNWSPVSTNTTKNINSVIWDGKKYIAAGDDGIVFIGEIK